MKKIGRLSLALRSPKTIVATKIAAPLRVTCLFCSQITLCLGEQLVADHEFFNRTRSQKGRIVVGVKKPVIAVLVP